MRYSDRVFVLVSFLFVLPWLSTASGTFKSWNPIDSVAVSERIRANGQRRSRSSGTRRSLAGNATTWNTVDGNPPLVIANGGSSGLFPDQTRPAYIFAANNSIQGDTAMFCDLQLTFDGFPVCRTGIDLSTSTTVNITFPQSENTYEVNGQKITGFFTPDFNASEIFLNLTATQSNPARSPYYDEMFTLLDPTLVLNYTGGSLLWLNVEYPGFYSSQFGYNMSGYVLSLLEQLPYDFVSSPEIAFLKAVSKGKPKTNLVLRFNGKTEEEPSTNVTYGSLLSDLKTIATYAAGIMVPKDYVWPVDAATKYLGKETTLVKDAHDAGLAIYVSGFLTDQSTPIYNYSFDPIKEYLQYIPSTGSIVDGFLTDFPSTASEAIACYRTPSTTKTSKAPLVISHNGASGDYPGCTILAYEAAVKDGADIIDCSIQITQDGVAICRESANLLLSTDVSTISSFFPARVSTISELDGKGLYSFNMTWDEIKTLKARIYTPGVTDLSGLLVRNPANDGTQSILSFSDFLTYAKNQSTGILVDIQNAYFLETQVGLDVLGAVITNLTAAGLINSSKLILQSEDSAVLEYLKGVTTSTLAYRVKSTNVTITSKEVKDIKALADRVTLPRGLIQRANSGSYLVNSTGVVELFHGQNMTVYVNFMRNVFTAIAFDYEADPHMELNTMVNFFKVDGLMTDFPATATAFLSKDCQDYQMRFVIPGDLLTAIPLPIPPVTEGSPLNVTQGPLPTTFGAKSGSSAPASSPGASPSASFCTPVPYFLVVLAILGSVFQNLFH